jgi:hypothetical protein
MKRDRISLGTTLPDFGIVVIVVWIISALLSLAISGGILAALIAGVYYLCTGEFLFAS